MAGIFYGVGVGPGDPELMTYKAVKCITSCPVVAVPAGKHRESTAYRIASGMVSMEGKRILRLDMPMTKERGVLAQAHQSGAKQIAGLLQEGQDVAFLTLGDPTIYSTYMYLRDKIEKWGYRTEIINGIPSFLAAAARVGLALAQGAEQIHVIPVSYPIRDAVQLPGTKIFMKAGSRIAALKEELMHQGGTVYTVENCGMEQEKCLAGAENMDENAGYYTLAIVWEEQGEQMQNGV